MLNILFVCHGNICRSVMAESMAAHMIATNKKLAGKVAVASAATHTDEIFLGPGGDGGSAVSDKGT